MRIRFGDAPARRAFDESPLVARIDGFWGEVARLEPSLMALRCTQTASDHLEARLTKAAQAVDRSLVVELDGPPGATRFALLPGDDPGLQPLIERILSRAPAIASVTPVRHRVALAPLAAIDEIRARVGVDLTLARARIGFSRGHLLDAVVYAPGFGSASDERALDAANLLLPRLLGDEVFDTWVGSVDVAPMPRPSVLRVLDEQGARAETLSLDDVAPAVGAAIRGVHDALPDDPWHALARGEKWTLLESEPPIAQDYSRQDDVAIVSTVIPEAMKCFLEGDRFASRRFSKRGERFAYVKVDARDDSTDRRHALRLELEDALNTALVPSALGAVVGIGMGARYVHVDMALADIDACVAVVRDALRRIGVNRRSWILFLDSEWDREWIGVWDDATPP